MTTFELPAQPGMGECVTDKDGDMYVTRSNEKGFQRWYLCQDDGKQDDARTANWTWESLLSAFGPLELVETAKYERLTNLYSSGVSGRACISCGALVWDLRKHTAWHAGP
jgi:hypothetical protein